MTRELRKDPTNQDLIAQLEAPAYAARINRLAKVQDNVNTVVANLLAPVQDTFDSVLRTIAETSFYQSLFGLQEQAGVKFPVIALNEKRVTEILNRRWSGKNFSERLWANSERLSSSVKRELMLGVLTGKTRHQMTQAIQEEFSSASYQTRRLIRTEATYVAGQMDLETYRRLGVEEYEYVAILDHRTSEICRELDGQRFLVEEAEVGVNYQPMHPWCRSSTVPVLPKGIEDRAIVQYYDAEGNTVRETLTESKKARAELAANPPEPPSFTLNSVSKADVVQFEKYKAIYGDSFPQDVYAFKEMKYNNKELWETYKANKQAVLNNLPIQELSKLKGKLGNKETRDWYNNKTAQIPNKIDRELPLEQQARQACELRRYYKFQARELMADQEARRQLDANPETRIKTFEEILEEKMRPVELDGKGLTREEAYYDIVESAATTNRGVNNQYHASPVIR